MSSCCAKWSNTGLSRSEERRVGSDWSSDVCSSDLESKKSKNNTVETHLARQLKSAVHVCKRNGPSTPLRGEQMQREDPIPYTAFMALAHRCQCRVVARNGAILG